MKILGILLLLAGWLIVLAAVALLGAAPGARLGFVLAGLFTEAVGLTYFVRSHVSARGVKRW